MRPAIVEFLESRIGTGFFVPGYDLLLAGAIVLGFYLALSEADRKGLDSSSVFRAGVAMAIAGFVAARLYVVLTHPDQFAGRPLAALEIWEGGTGSTGAYIGGFVAAPRGRTMAVALPRPTARLRCSRGRRWARRRAGRMLRQRVLLRKHIRPSLGGALS